MFVYLTLVVFSYCCRLGLIVRYESIISYFLWEDKAYYPLFTSSPLSIVRLIISCHMPVLDDGFLDIYWGTGGATGLAGALKVFMSGGFYWCVEVVLGTAISTLRPCDFSKRLIISDSAFTLSLFWWCKYRTGFSATSLNRFADYGLIIWELFYLAPVLLFLYWLFNPNVDVDM
jgi:hypothetical protein